MGNKVRVELYDKDKHYEKVMRMKLREADERELSASTGCSSSAVGLQRSLEGSDLVCYIYLCDDNVIAVSGASRTELSVMAIVWAMATDEVFEHWQEVEPLFKKHVNAVLAEPGIEIISNIIDLRNDTHIRWIKKLGFTLSGQVVQLNGYDFEGFYKRRRDLIDV